NMTGSGTILQLNDSTENININNCLFNMPIASGDAIAHTGKAAMNLSIDRCRFYGGNSGMNLGVTPSTDINDAIKFANCIMDSIADMGITITKGKGILIQNNTITSSRPGVEGIILYNCHYGFTIDRNK